MSSSGAFFLAREEGGGVASSSSSPPTSTSSMSISERGHSHFQASSATRSVANRTVYTSSGGSTLRRRRAKRVAKEGGFYVVSDSDERSESPSYVVFPGELILVSSSLRSSRLSLLAPTLATSHLLILYQPELLYDNTTYRPSPASSLVLTVRPFLSSLTRMSFKLMPGATSTFGFEFEY